MTDPNEAPAPAAPLHPRWLVASGNFFFRIRNALFPVVFGVVLLVLRPAHFLNNADVDRWVMAIGTALALLGQGFRLLVIGYAYIVRGGKNKQVYARDLVVAGLYAHSRNPMYVGNFLIACGVGMVFGSPWMYVVVIPFFAYVYLAITAAEEVYLHARFGAQYEDYMTRVNRFWPDFRGIRRSLAGYRFRWKEVLSKDHGTMFATLAGLIIIAMWKKVYLHGWDTQQESVARMAYLFIPLLLFYAMVRVLKKQGRLRDDVRTGTP
jgi:protein-S-isoprenylcysteine O-methyltransferase Ste14